MSGATVATTAAVIGAGAAVAGAGIAAHQGNKAAKEAKKNAAISRDQMAKDEIRADKVEAQADEAFNAANKKRPNTSRLKGENIAATKSGAGSTMLTGTSGIGADSLNLASNTLLGS